ncbi:hypothetical protein BD408DRAFT_446828 [Parasitella parasitica]|nr:hypothetical protein BD408DRAFT_446828 [Parasitella parasitica]
MKASYCVDYLSHQWSSDDLIQTYRENCKQRHMYIVDNITSTTSLLRRNEKRLKKSEQYKLLRYQNALWRSMARNCTHQLSQSNKLIDPSTVSWQKESDITWLYGPMYTAVENKEIHVEKLPKSIASLYTPHPNAQAASDMVTNSLQGLKPVLKKQSNVTQPTCSDPMYYFDSWSGSTTPSTCTSRSGRSSFSSISSSKSNSIGVHFNPEIIEIEYQPEYPVSLETSTQPCLRGYSVVEEDDDDNEEDDMEALWSLLVQASVSLKSSTYTRLGFISKYISYHHHHQQNQHSNQQSLYPATTASSKNIQILILLVSMMKSMVSMTTTWLLWQSLSPLTWIAKKASSSSSSSASSSSSNVAAGHSKHRHQKKIIVS